MRRVWAFLFAGVSAAAITGSVLLLRQTAPTYAMMRQLKIAYVTARDSALPPIDVRRERRSAPGKISITTKSCAPQAENPIFYGCFLGNSPYRHRVASLLKAGATVHADATAVNYWNNGNPLTANNINADGNGSTKMWIASPTDPSYSITCPAYGPGSCNAATSVTGRTIRIPSDAAPTADSDHHIFIFDPMSAQEVDMWGGFDPSQACQVGRYKAAVLACSWGGRFAFRGTALASVAGNSGIAGGVAYGMAAITAGDILRGHIAHALGIVGPCLDDDGQYPSTPGRGSDSACKGNAAGHRDGAEPTLRYGDMIHLKSSVNLESAPYSDYSPRCRVVVRALQEYGAYADDNSSGYGLHLLVLNQADPGWRTIMASMIGAGDASGTPGSAVWDSCLNRIRGGDLETITLNQGDGTIRGGDAVLPPSIDR